MTLSVYYPFIKHTQAAYVKVELFLELLQVLLASPNGRRYGHDLGFSDCHVGLLYTEQRVADDLSTQKM